MRHPVSDFDSAGQHAADLEVQDRLACCQYPTQTRLNLRGEASKDFTHGLAQMARRGHAVDSGQGIVNREITQISVHDAKAHVGGAEEGRQQLFGLAEGIRSGVGENAVHESPVLGAHELNSSTRTAAMIADRRPSGRVNRVSGTGKRRRSTQRKQSLASSPRQGCKPTCACSGA